MNRWSRAAAGLILACLGAVSGLAAGADPVSGVKEIYVVVDNHLDIGFTKPEDQVAKTFAGYVDEAVEIADDFDLPWTFETLWPIQQWLAGKPDPERVKLLGDLLQAGKMGLTGSEATLHTALLAPEELNRYFYAAEDMRRRFGIPIETAIMNDVPGYAWGLPGVMGGSGIKYLITGNNTTLGGRLSLGRSDNPFYWQGPDGARVLTWMCNVSDDAYQEGRVLYKLASAAAMESAVKNQLRLYAEQGYPYDAILIQFNSGDNAPPRLGLQLAAGVWNRTHASPKMIVGPPELFFRHMEEKYGPQIPTFAGDWSGVWEAGRLMNPRGNAYAREIASGAPAAETLLGLLSLSDGGPARMAEFAKLYDDLRLYREHSQLQGPGWPSMLSKEETVAANRLTFARIARAYGAYANLREEGLARLGRHAADKGEILVYNPLSWERTDVVRVGTTLGAGTWEAVDSRTDEAVPVQRTADGYCFAARVPGLGHSVFRLRPAAASPVPVAGSQATTLENNFYKVAVSPATGAILSLLDKRAGRELLRQGEGAAVCGRNGRQYNSESFSPPLKGEALAILPAGRVAVRTERGPVYSSIVVTHDGSPEARLTVTLYEQLPLVEIAGLLDRRLMPEVPYDRHSQHYVRVFPFDLGACRAVYDGGGGLARVGEDVLPGAPTGVFYPQSGVTLTDEGGFAVTVAGRQNLGFAFGPLHLLRTGGIPPGAPLLALEASRIDYGQTKDSGVTSFPYFEPVEDRAYTFAYAVTSGKVGDPVDRYRFTRGYAQPLLARAIEGGGNQAESRALPPGLAVEGPPGVEIVLFKQAQFDEPGDFLLRLRNLGATTAKARLRLPRRAARAWLADTVERRISPLQVEEDRVTVEVPARGTVGIRLRF